jgi:hypothetical protein
MSTGRLPGEPPRQVDRDRIALPEVQASARRLALLDHVAALDQHRTTMLQCSTDMISVDNHDGAYTELLVEEQLGRKEEARLAELLGLEPADIICVERQVFAHPDWYRGDAPDRVLIYRDHEPHRAIEIATGHRVSGCLTVWRLTDEPQSAAPWSRPPRGKRLPRV